MRYAALFTTYAWDEFVERQYRRIASRVHAGDLYVMVDETNTTLPSLPIERVIRTNQEEILHHGGRHAFVEKGDWEVKGALWWNLDYLTYRFYDDHQEYDYCITMDYDACVNLDVDQLMADVAARGYDFVALPVEENMHHWFWQKPHRGIYPPQEIQAHLLCVIIISRKAANYLAERRREMSAAYQAGDIKFWPFCEAFMSTELKRGGFRIGNIADFGDTKNFGWWPIYNENDLMKSMPSGFIHPILDEGRFLKAYLQRYKPMQDIFLLNSPFWKRLRQFSFASYASYLWPVMRVRILRWLRRSLGNLRKKYIGARLTLRRINGEPEPRKIPEQEQALEP